MSRNKKKTKKIKKTKKNKPIKKNKKPRMNNERHYFKCRSFLAVLSFHISLDNVLAKNHAFIELKLAGPSQIWMLKISGGKKFSFSGKFSVFCFLIIDKLVHNKLTKCSFYQLLDTTVRKKYIFERSKIFSEYFKWLKGMGICLTLFSKYQIYAITQ